MAVSEEHEIIDSIDEIGVFKEKKHELVYFIDEIGEIGECVQRCVQR